jgi:hypothetical protein
MDRKSAIAAATLALAAGAVSAQTINFTAVETVPFSQMFDPDGGVFTPGQFTSGEEGVLTANQSGTFTLTYLGQESAFTDGIRISVGGAQLSELSSALGASITGSMTAGSALTFTFFGSDNSTASNGEVFDTTHPSWAVVARDVETPIGSFAYVLGFNDSANHDDWDDFVVGLNPTAPIPEPQTYALLLAGLGVVGFVARRRQAR